MQKVDVCLFVPGTSFRGLQIANFDGKNRFWTRNLLLVGVVIFILVGVHFLGFVLILFYQNHQNLKIWSKWHQNQWNFAFLGAKNQKFTSLSSCFLFLAEAFALAFALPRALFFNLVKIFDFGQNKSNVAIAGSKIWFVWIKFVNFHLGLGES